MGADPLRGTLPTPSDFKKFDSASTPRPTLRDAVGQRRPLERVQQTVRRGWLDDARQRAQQAACPTASRDLAISRAARLAPVGGNESDWVRHRVNKRSGGEIGKCNLNIISKIYLNG